MFLLLAAFVFWLMLNNRLGVYAGFVTTANGSGKVFPNGFSIPVSLSVVGSSIASATGMGVNPNSATGAPNELANIPQFGSLFGSQQSYGNAAGAANPADSLFAAATGNYWNGMPSYSSVQSLFGQAQGNVNAGAPGL